MEARRQTAEMVGLLAKNKFLEKITAADDVVGHGCGGHPGGDVGGTGDAGGALPPTQPLGGKGTTRRVQIRTDCSQPVVLRDVSIGVA